MTEIAVAIVEDRDDVRKGLSYLIDGSDGFRCVGAFPAAEPALASFSLTRVDVVLMDIELPGMNGIEATRRLKARWPEIQVMMLTVYGDDDRIFQSLQAGATGYVLKKTPPDELLRDIQALHEGGSPMSGGIARRIVETFHGESDPDPEGEGEPLTARETEVLELLAQGYRYREIAERLTISFDTVRTHIRHIYEKMHVRSRTEAAVKYLQSR